MGKDINLIVDPSATEKSNIERLFEQLFFRTKVRPEFFENDTNNRWGSSSLLHSLSLTHTHTNKHNSTLLYTAQKFVPVK
jgi:hypothetical protein